jgi:hypothetical protein
MAIVAATPMVTAFFRSRKMVVRISTEGLAGEVLRAAESFGEIDSDATSRGATEGCIVKNRMIDRDRPIGRRI